MWKTVLRPKRFGKTRAKREHELTEQYGKGMWHEAWTWGERGELTVPIDIAFLIYEDAYYEYFIERPKVVDWLTSYNNVYDTNLSNTASGFDYFAQEDPNVRHVQDIAIRRALLRIGKPFKGEGLLEVRNPGKHGYFLTPGKIQFHIPAYIVTPHATGWWRENSVEDFYQSNRVIQIKVR